MISIDAYSVHLDFIKTADNCNVAVLSYFDRSLSLVKAFSGMLSLNTKLYVETCKKSFTICDSKFQTFIQPIVVGKEKFYHAISLNKDLNDKILLFENGQEGTMIYDYLMKQFDFPLLPSWGDAIYRYYVEEGIIWSGKDETILGVNSITETIPLKGREVALSSIRAEKVFIQPDDIKDAIKKLFSRKEICITKDRQNPLAFSDMNSYFSMYGSSLVENLTKTIEPLTELDGDVHDFTLKNMVLYPQQIAQINGDVKLLEKCNYAILNHGMGTGKTIVAASICESFFVRKWIRSHPGMALKDAYASEGTVVYRNVIMCPGHLVEKWANEIRREIPYAQVTVLRNFSQLIEVRAHGAERMGKEWFVMSKDFGKLSYQSEPTPKKMRYGQLKVKECKVCGEEYYLPGHTCPNCESREYKLSDLGHKDLGMVCPNCNNILLPYRKTIIGDELDEPCKPLSHIDFKYKNEANSRCYYCETELWQPHVANLGDSRKRVKWIRATHYANKAHKSTKTVWVHKDYITEYFENIGETPLRIMDTDIAKGARKYSPVEFIKRYLKGYFDIAIFDEVHELKGGTTGQGHAMHSLVRSSKKQIALTGTIAGGYASNLFYILFRLDPRRMRDKGFQFSDEIKFAEKYGKLERQYEYVDQSEDEKQFNASCKGRQKGTVKMKPGISPLIYMDFLLDRTTSLDLTDMSKYLPPLKEKVISVKSEGEEIEVLEHYKTVISSLKKASREKGMGGLGLLSNMLQFSLSYMDKPFNVSPILSPTLGCVVAKPRSYEQYHDIKNYDSLLSKEKKLVEIIKTEIKEGRNCFIYAEYTGSPETCITARLKDIVENHCDLKGKVAILEASSPSASQREKWIQKKAKEGIKVFITNPRCTATGLDFCFTLSGVAYNYPTIIFYQMGYSMFDVWQASRRHYRLNQTKECRTYYMAWEGTAQQAAISLIAEKQASTSAIQGKFSTEGLTAMANGVDTRMKLAQSLSDMDSFSGNELQKMFDVLAMDETDDSAYIGYRRMILFKELMSEDNIVEKTVSEMTTIGSFDMWALFNIGVAKKTVNVDIDADQNETVDLITCTKNKQQVRKRKKALEGQFSLF